MNGAPETDYYNGLNGHGGGNAHDDSDKVAISVALRRLFMSTTDF